MQDNKQPIPADGAIAPEDWVSRVSRVGLTEEVLISRFGSMFLTLEDLVELFGFGRDAIMVYIRDGSLKGAKVGNRWKFYCGDVVAFWAELTSRSIKRPRPVESAPLFGQNKRPGVGGRRGHHRPLRSQAQEK